MDTTDYKKKVEQQLIKEFLDKFYEKVGYYPTVLTDTRESDSIKILTLNELEDYFTPFLPTIFGKKVTLSNKNRTRFLVELRFIFFFIARQMRYTLKEIGQHVGKRDHTTVLHGLSTFVNLYETDARFKMTYNAIIHNIKRDYEPSTLEYLNQMELES
jgi:hypothetical protein